MTERFKLNIEEIRKKARSHIEEGAVTPGYRANHEQIVQILNDALATELLCTLRYKEHAAIAQGPFAEPVKRKLNEFAAEEWHHAEELAERIEQLGGIPQFSPEVIARRAHSEYRTPDSLPDLLKEDLVSERIVIDIYREIARYLKGKDETSRRLIEHLLAEEEAHADQLQEFLEYRPLRQFLANAQGDIEERGLRQAQG